MGRSVDEPVALSRERVRRMALLASGLDVAAPFGDGAAATRAAVEHLGYVQIDTINVIERCHHQILYTRIPGYAREHLRTAQTVEKSVFEYWTHALSYVPTRDLRFFIGDMKRNWQARNSWFAGVTAADLRKVFSLVRAQGALTIRDIDDDVLVEKDHAWASRKPSRKALQLAFLQGRLAVSERTGMLKTYDLAERHFGWEKMPKAASEREVIAYVLERGLRAQGIVSVESLCFLNAPRKPGMRALIEKRVRLGALVPVVLEGAGKTAHWTTPALLEARCEGSHLVHVLSPFDPLMHQRQRVRMLFDYEHLFEAYVPKEKRRFGYFTQAVLAGDEIVAAVDLKTDRAGGKLLVQQWTWVGHGVRRKPKRQVEEALHRFERFQLGR